MILRLAEFGVQSVYTTTNVSEARSLLQFKVLHGQWSMLIVAVTTSSNRLLQRLHAWRPRCRANVLY